jgi:hypothetical protein
MTEKEKTIIKSWDSKEKKFIETPKKIKEFFNDIDILCKKHNLSISHEDGHGAFIIKNYDVNNIEWLKSANLLTI